MIAPAGRWRGDARQFLNAGSSVSRRWAKQSCRIGRSRADVADAKDVAAWRRRLRGRGARHGANRELAGAATADHHSDRARRQSRHRGAYARQQADRTFRPTGDRRERHPGRRHRRQPDGVEVGAGRIHIGNADRRVHHAGGGDESAALRSGPRFCLRDQRRHLSDVPAGRSRLADQELQGADRSRSCRTRQGELRHHRRRQRVSPARQMDREPRRRRDDGGAVSRIGARLHRRGRRPARCHDRYRNLGDSAHPQWPGARARGVVAGTLSADAGHADDARDRARYQADVVARPGGTAANAARHHRPAQRRDPARTGTARRQAMACGDRGVGCAVLARRAAASDRDRDRALYEDRRGQCHQGRVDEDITFAAPSLTGDLAIPTIHQSLENDMKLMYFDDYKLGLVKGDAVVDVSSVVQNIAHTGPHDLINGVIARFAEYRPRLEEAVARGKGVPLAGVKIRPPLPKPVNIDCMAVNYMEDGTRTEPAPINAFHKSPNAVIGPEDTMALPDVPATIFEGEAEVALVIGKRAKDVKAAEAMEYVFGYLNFIDGSARGLPPPGNVFYQMKSRDTFAPMGPYIVTADEIRDPHQLQVRLWVNGVLKQNFNTSDMAHKIPRCIEWVSSIHTLEPGDVLATGTNHRGLSSFQDGDVVELESDGLGRLRFHVRDELKRTWGRETRLDMANKGSKEITTPQLTGKYAARP